MAHYLFINFKVLYSRFWWKAYNTPVETPLVSCMHMYDCLSTATLNSDMHITNIILYEQHYNVGQTVWHVSNCTSNNTNTKTQRNSADRV